MIKRVGNKYYLCLDSRPIKQVSKAQGEKAYDLKNQANFFDMDVDWESGRLRRKGHFKVDKHPNLQRWIDDRADKQFDHEVMNRDGGR